VKEEINKDIESLQKKKNQTETLETKSSLGQIKNNTVKHYFNRLQQIEDRLSGLKDKIGIEENLEKYLDKRLKTC
jgi:conjugal transfer/entry exclusion protein